MALLILGKVYFENGIRANLSNGVLQRVEEGAPECELLLGQVGTPLLLRAAL